MVVMLSERLGLKNFGQNTTLSLYLVVFGENSQISQKKKNFCFDSKCQIDKFLKMISY